MSEQSAENDAALTAVLRGHTRLTCAEKPFTCTCQPNVRDSTQTFTEHLIAAYASVIASADGGAS